MRPIVAFGLGAFWINSALVIAAAVDTLRADLSTTTSLACACCSRLRLPRRRPRSSCMRGSAGPREARLQGIQAWIMQNQQGVTAGVAFVLAVWLGVRGSSG